MNIASLFCRHKESCDAEKLRHFAWCHKEGSGRDEIRSHRWLPVYNKLLSLAGDCSPSRRLHTSPVLFNLSTVSIHHVRLLYLWILKTGFLFVILSSKNKSTYYRKALSKLVFKCLFFEQKKSLCNIFFQASSLRYTQLEIRPCLMPWICLSDCLN